jgi:hypothetical protein
MVMVSAARPGWRIGRPDDVAWWEHVGMRVPPMPWRLYAVCAAAGCLAGAILGFVRGLSYLPTLPVAIVEGGLLIGVPASLLGLVLTGAYAAWPRRRIR